MLTIVSYLDPLSLIGVTMGDLSLPTVNFTRLTEAAYERPFQRISGMYYQPGTRKTMQPKDGAEAWIPSIPGAMVEYIPIRPGEGYTDGNAVFKEGEIGLALTRGSDYLHYTDPHDEDFEAHYSDLCQNLLYYKRNYQKALEDAPRSRRLMERKFRKKMRNHTHVSRSSQMDQYDEFAELYTDYLRQKLVEIENHLNRYRQETRDFGCGL